MQLTPVLSRELLEENKENRLTNISLGSVCEIATQV